MSLWDPEAAGSAALWLRLPMEEMMAIQTSEYPGRAAVWVPFAETGYTKGIVQGDGDKADTKKVMRSDGKEKEYKVSLNYSHVKKTSLTRWRPIPVQQFPFLQRYHCYSQKFNRAVLLVRWQYWSTVTYPTYSTHFSIIFWDEKFNKFF